MDVTPDEDEGRWLTYRQIAELRGISKASAERLVRRHSWRRQADNQGVTRVLVPQEWADMPAGSGTNGTPDIMGAGAPDVTPDTTAFEAALAAVREAKDGEIATLHSVIEDLRSTAIRTEGRAATAEARADAAVTRAEVADADRRAAEQRAEAERARAEVLADKLTEERMRAEQFRTAAQDALQAAEAARAEAQTVRAAEETAKIARAQAEADAAKLRQAEMARKAKGLLARLRGAWRGE